MADAFTGGDVDLVISAAGILTGQAELERDPLQAGVLVQTNFTGHVTTLLAAAARLRAQGHGTIVVLSSVAAVRPRKANLVYGAAKSGLDAFARGLADSLHGSGVRLLLVRPGFVAGRMTAGMTPARWPPRRPRWEPPSPPPSPAAGHGLGPAVAGRARRRTPGRAQATVAPAAPVRTRPARPSPYRPSRLSGPASQRRHARFRFTR